MSQPNWIELENQVKEFFAPQEYDVGEPKNDAGETLEECLAKIPLVKDLTLKKGLRFDAFEFVVSGCSEKIYIGILDTLTKYLELPADSYDWSKWDGEFFEQLGRAETALYCNCSDDTGLSLLESLALNAKRLAVAKRLHALGLLSDDLTGDMTSGQRDEEGVYTPTTSGLQNFMECCLEVWYTRLITEVCQFINQKVSDK